MSEINGTKSEHGRRKRKQRLIAVLVPAALVVTAAGGYAVTRGDEAVASGIGCYETASKEGNVTVQAATGESPVAICERLWEQGVIRKDVSSAPGLVACADRSAVHVFPTTDDGTCGSFGMTSLPADYEEAAASFAEMRDEVTARFEQETAAADGCLSPDTARSLARRVLDRHGFDKWAVVDGGGLAGDGFDAERPCANGLAFDDASRTIVLVPEEAR